jgi:hypothetical protein
LEDPVRAGCQAVGRAFEKYASPKLIRRFPSGGSNHTPELVPRQERARRQISSVELVPVEMGRKLIHEGEERVGGRRHPLIILRP